MLISLQSLLNPRRAPARYTSSPNSVSLKLDDFFFQYQ
jgi:hypothetical protein